MNALDTKILSKFKSLLMNEVPSYFNGFDYECSLVYKISENKAYTISLKYVHEAYLKNEIKVSPKPFGSFSKDISLNESTPERLIFTLRTPSYAEYYVNFPSGEQFDEALDTFQQELENMLNKELD